MLDDPIITAHPELFRECFDFSPPEGWRGIVAALCDKLAERQNIRVSQVKEKFGGLRVYVHAAHELPEGAPTDWASELVRAAESEAAHTCQRCASPNATLRRGPWWLTLCDGCAS